MTNKPSTKSTPFQPEHTEKLLVEKLRGYFKERGYKWHQDVHQFRKPTTNGFQCVILSVSPYPDAAVVEFHIGIRLDAVENLAFPYTNGLKEFQPNSMTLVTPLSRIFDKRYQRFTIKKAQELDTIVDLFIQQLEERGWKFLQNHQQIAQLEALYNQHPNQPLYFAHQQVNRALRGLTLAKLTQRKDIIHLVSQYDTLLKNQYATPVEKAKFAEYSEFLLNYSMN